MSEELQKRIDAHDSEIREHGKMLSQVSATLSGLVHTVDGLPEKINQEFDTVHKRLDKNAEQSRPDTKWAVTSIGAALTLVMTAFTIILNLTITPMRDDTNKHEIQYADHVHDFQELSRDMSSRITGNESTFKTHMRRAEDRVSYFTKWNDAQAAYINKLREEVRLLGERVSSGEARDDNHDRWIEAVDGRGSRKWIGYKQR